MFDINPAEAAPIWKQIEEGMRRMIALGSLGPSEPVPSVRELAQRLRVNPNTVARAYQRLTDAGVLTVRRGEGTYVAESPTPTRRTERNEKLRDAAVRYAGSSIAVGASQEDAAAELKTAFERVVQDHRRKK